MLIRIIRDYILNYFEILTIILICDIYLISIRAAIYPLQERKKQQKLIEKKEKIIHKTAQKVFHLKKSLE